MMCGYTMFEVGIIFAAISMVCGRDYIEPCGATFTNGQGWFVPPTITESERKAATQIRGCLWIIKNTENKMIKLQINDLEMDDHPNCQNDRIEVEDDHQKLGTFCGTEAVAPIFTKSSVMYVVTTMYLETIRTYKFNASFWIVELWNKYCGGILNQTSGWFSSLDLDGDFWYDANMDCSWMITAQQFNIIGIRFKYIDVQGGRGCQEDYVELEDDGVIDRYCGTRQIPVFTSKTNLVRVKFHTDYGEQGEGFNVTYLQTPATAIMCGGVVNNAQGLIISPDEYGDVMYYEKHECLWIIDAEEYKRIDFEIVQMEIEESINCWNKSVSVFDDSVNYGVFCGNYKPPVITSEANILYVRFKSIDNFHGTGFSARYLQKYVFGEDCGGYLNESTGWMVYHSSNEENNVTLVDCFWVVDGMNNTEVDFDIRALDIPKSSPCKDYLMVFDIHSPKIKICGSEVYKNPFRSVTNKLFVRLYSESPKDTVFRGFYRQLKALSKECGGIIDASVPGYISNPDYDKDGQYDYNLDCLFDLRANPNHFVVLDVNAINLEHSTRCHNDYLEIYEAEGADIPDVHCGDYIYLSSVYQGYLVRLSQSSSIYVHFVTDGSGNFPGFRIHYYERADFERYCEGLTNSTSGWFSPVVDILYINFKEMVDCTYGIQVSDGYVVRIPEFQLKLDTTFNCQTEFLEIDSTGKICGNMLTPVFQSKRRNVLIHYALEQLKLNSRFNLTYYQVKDSSKKHSTELRKPEGQLTVPQNIQVLIFNYALSWTILGGDKQVILFHIHRVQFVGLTSERSEQTEQIRVTEDLKSHFARSAFDIINRPCFECSSFITDYNKLTVEFYTDEWSKQYLEHLNASYRIIDDNFDCSEEYRCLGENNITISRDNVCDNVQDCLYADDERFCDLVCLPNCTCMGLIMDCSGKTFCNVTKRSSPSFRFSTGLQKMRILDLSSNPELFHTLSLETAHQFSYLERLNISHCKIKSLIPNFFQLLARLEILDLSYNELMRIPTGLFRHLIRLTSLKLDGNKAVLDFESTSFTGLSSLKNLKMEYLHVGRISKNAFSGLNLNTFHLSYTIIDYVEEGGFNELSVHGVFLNTTKIIASSDLLFEGIRNMTYIDSNAYKLCCLLPSYLSRTVCFPKQDTISTCYDLLGKEKYVLWIAGISSIITNFFSLRRHFTFDRKELGFGHNFFLLNLAVSDSLMGVYDIIITGTDIAFSGIYASIRDKWLADPLCQFATVISLVSVFSSSSFVCLISLARFFAVKYPSGEIKFNRKLSVSLMLLVWFLAVLFSTVPLIYSTLEGYEVYSQFGVCFGLRMDSKSPRELVFAIGVLMCLAVTICLLITVSQWLISVEKRATKANLIRERLLRSSDLRTSRNILVLVSIDAVCLLMTAILGILGIGEKATMDKDQVTLMTIIILSILSTMNPIMYNLSALFSGFEEFSPSQDEQKRPRLCTKEEYDTVLSLITNPRYWKRGMRHRSFKRLSIILKRGEISKSTCTLVAYGIAARIAGLHHRGLIQEELTSRDILVNRSLITGKIKIVLMCRPKLVMEQADKNRNIKELGMVLSELIEKVDDKPKEEQTSTTRPWFSIRSIRRRK